MTRNVLARRRSAVTALFATATLTAVMAGVVVGTSGCKQARFGNMLSKSQEVEIGQQGARDVERKYKIDDDPAINDRMQRIAARVFPQARKDFDVNYTVKVIDSKEVNAFALPGGPIYFYRGLIELAGSDDEIAAVLGHEAAHVSMHHSAKQISDAQGKGLIASLVLGGQSSAVQTLANIGLSLDQLSYSRGDEGQSDEVGFRYYTAAGYAPDAMASFFRKMAAKGGGRGPQWLSSHPVTRQRIERAEARAAALEKSNG
jgi:predicted Zn-dependent protease